MSWRKNFYSFKNKQKKEESFFPSTLKNEKDIIVQKENFEQVKMQFKGVKEQEQLLDSAITDQIYQHLFFTHIILEQATNRPLRKNEITIFLETQKYVQLLKDRKKVLTSYLICCLNYILKVLYSLENMKMKIQKI